MGVGGVVVEGGNISNLIEMNMTNKASINFKITNERSIFSIPARITSPEDALDV